MVTGKVGHLIHYGATLIPIRWGTKSVSQTLNTILLQIMINIIIDNDKSPKIRINFRQVPATLYFTLQTPVPVQQNPANRIIY